MWFLLVFCRNGVSPLFSIPAWLSHSIAYTCSLQDTKQLFFQHALPFFSNYNAIPLPSHVDLFTQRMVDKSLNFFETIFAYLIIANCVPERFLQCPSKWYYKLLAKEKKIYTLNIFGQDKLFCNVKLYIVLVLTIIFIHISNIQCAILKK